MRGFLAVSLIAGFGALGGRVVLAQQVPPDSASVATSVRIRIVPSVGIMVVRRPAFNVMVGSRTPRNFTESEETSSGFSAGGRIEAIGARWWAGVDAQVTAYILDSRTSFIAAANIGRRVPGALGGELRLGLGPVLVTSTRRFGFLGGFCLSDCSPVVYPPDLVTGGLGLAMVQEWRPWRRVGVGLEGHVATGAQRLASARARVALGR
jgi:hypothetical protein